LRVIHDADIIHFALKNEKMKAEKRNSFSAFLGMVWNHVALSCDHAQLVMHGLFSFVE